MTTLVGTQENFHDALYELCELDYDAVEAYEAAINRLENNNYKEHLSKFKAEHQRHVEELRMLLKKHNENFPEGPSAKQILAQGKVVFADMFGDEAMLKAMLSNEKDTNEAYETINSHKGMWPDAVEILEKGFSDEKRHKRWLESIVNK